MGQPRLPVLVIGGLAAFGLCYAVFGTPKPQPSIDHAAQVSKASRAFCNCLKTKAYLQECLAGAEQGDGHEVNDQELLLSRCLDGDRVTVLHEPAGSE